MSPELREALEAVLAYMGEDERRDFDRQDEEGKAHHIYQSLEVISDALDDDREGN